MQLDNSYQSYLYDESIIYTHKTLAQGWRPSKQFFKFYFSGYKYWFFIIIFNGTFIQHFTQNKKKHTNSHNLHNLNRSSMHMHKTRIQRKHLTIIYHRHDLWALIHNLARPGTRFEKRYAHNTTLTGCSRGDNDLPRRFFRFIIIMRLMSPTLASKYDRLHQE